jgi:hypothetical protein
MCILPSGSGRTLPSRGTRPHPPSDADPATNRDSAIVITDHLKWARTIARGVSLAYYFRLGSQEEQDLVATAYLAIVELAARFDATRVAAGGDPNCAFRGWATIEIRCRCNREARRLRNGGTYKTRREKLKKALVIMRLKKSNDLVDPLSLVDEDDNEDDTDF